MSPTSPRWPGRLVRAASLVLLLGVGAAAGHAAGRAPHRAAAPAPAPAPGPCAAPEGVDVSALSAADRGWLARRLVLCEDYRHGRLSLERYQEAVAALDRPRPVEPPLPSVLWASSVREQSSQWSTESWSAARVLGPPDARAGADDANAWASAGADDRVEFLEVTFERAVRAHGVQVIESLNPGAVSRIEVLTADGERLVAYEAEAAPLDVPFNRRTVDFACTPAPVVAVRITLDARAVAGWNEIDAIGLRPCAGG